MSGQLSKRLLELMAKSGLVAADLPISEPELHRKLHAKMSAAEKEEIRALLNAPGQLEAGA